MRKVVFNKLKRQEINKRVSETLRERASSRKRAIQSNCVVCNNFFQHYRKKLTCSEKCANSLRKRISLSKLKTPSKRGPGYYVRRPKSILDFSSRTTSKILQRLSIGYGRCGWNEAPCDIHHINGRKIPDPDNHKNLAYLCPNCHRLFHKNKITASDVKSLEDQIGDSWKKLYYK